MTGKKIIAVMGATGAQGGGLVRAIMSDAGGDFTARALTRNVDSDKAKELAKLGVEVVAAEDIGRCAYGIFKRGSEFIGKTVGIAGEHLTGEQMAKSLAKAPGHKVAYNNVPPEVYRGFEFPGAEDLGNMFQFKRDFEQVYCRARNLDIARSLNHAL